MQQGPCLAVTGFKPIEQGRGEYIFDVVGPVTVQDCLEPAFWRQFKRGRHSFAERDRMSLRNRERGWELTLEHVGWTDERNEAMQLPRLAVVSLVRLTPVDSFVIPVWAGGAPAEGAGSKPAAKAKQPAKAKG